MIIGHFDMPRLRNSRAILISSAAAVMLALAPCIGIAHAEPDYDNPPPHDPPTDPSPNPALLSAAAADTSGCVLNGHATYNRSTDVLVLRYSAGNPYLFGACRGRLSVRYHYTGWDELNPEGFENISGPHSYDVPTVCGSFGGCPSWETGAMTVPDAIPYLRNYYRGAIIHTITLTAGWR